MAAQPERSDLGHASQRTCWKLVGADQEQGERRLHLHQRDYERAARSIADQPLLAGQQVAAVGCLRPGVGGQEIAAGLPLGDSERTERAVAQQHLRDLASLVLIAPGPNRDGGQHCGAQSGRQHQVPPRDHADEGQELLERCQTTAEGLRDELGMYTRGTQHLESLRRRLLPLVVPDKLTERNRRIRIKRVAEDPLQLAGRRLGWQHGDQLHARSDGRVNCSIAKARASPPSIPTSS